MIFSPFILPSNPEGEGFILNYVTPYLVDVDENDYPCPAGAPGLTRRKRAKPGAPAEYGPWGSLDRQNQEISNLSFFMYHRGGFVLSQVTPSLGDVDEDDCLFGETFGIVDEFCPSVLRGFSGGARLM